MKQPLAVGDKVQYSPEWLRSTGQYTGDICFAKGVIMALHTLTPSGYVLAEIAWDICNIPVKVNVKNLVRVR